MKPLTINGTPVSFERRRYGTQFYCWVYAQINDKWTCLGDPWPCSTPKHSEIAEAIALEMKSQIDRLHKVRDLLAPFAVIAIEELEQIELTKEAQ